MPIIERYILRQLAQAYALCSILLLGLFGFFDLNIQLQDVGHGMYSTRDAVIYTLLGMPLRLVDLMPFTALMATVATLGIMAQHRELVILRATGISALRVAGMIGKAALLLVVINIALQTSVAPALQQRAERMKASALAGQQIDVGDGFWIRSRTGVVHIGRLRAGRLPVDIAIYRFASDHALAQYIHADSANTISAHRWQLHGVTIKHLAARANTTTRRAVFDWDPGLYPNQVKILNQSPASQSPQALYHYIRYLKAQGRNALLFQVAFWQKLSVLVTTLAMMLFGIPLTFTNPRGTSFALRLVIGGMIGLAVYASGQATANLCLLLELNPAAASLAPGILFCAIALFWLRRVS